MDPRTGKGSAPKEPTPLRAAPGLDANGLTDPPNHIGDVEGHEDLREDVVLLRDAVTLVTARQRDGLLLQLAADPFNPVAYRGLGSDLVGPGVLAPAACERLRASTVRGT